MAHTLPDLPYAYDALEPYISQATMVLHHTKHQQGYVDALNAAEAVYIKDPTPEQRLVLEAAWKFHGGGHNNHFMFWNSLAPPASEGKGKGGIVPDGIFKDLLVKSFGSLEAMIKEFNAKASGIQGSGWGWIGFNLSTKLLEVVTTPNEDRLESHSLIIGIDIWEHAYYLQYQNSRTKYLDAIWNVVNFESAQDRLIEALDRLDSDISGALLTNTGTVTLTIVNENGTFKVLEGASYRVTTAATDTLVEATGKTIATIRYKDSNAFTVLNGDQVTNAEFDLKLSMKN